MPIIRNPFRRQDENARPNAPVAEKPNATTTPPKSIDLGEKQDTEYKLSEINDSGVCLPPSPGEERKSFWGHTNSSRSTTSSTTHRSLIKENEPFNISRESFDSYRRSFDISGRSPVIGGDRPRASLDSRTFQSFQSSPRKSTNLQRPAPVPLTSPMREEEDFEDVGLNDDPKPAQQAAPPKKRGFLSRLTESSNDQAAPGATSGQESKWHFGGRKRGQSGQGAELGSMPQPSRENTPKPVAPESGLRHSETPKHNDTPEKADGNVQTPTPTES